MDSSTAATSSGSGRPSILVLGLSLTAILFIWSFNYIAGKIALRHMSALSLASFRMVSAAIIMLPIYFASGRRLPFRGRDLWTFAYLGFFGIIINQGCFIFGLNYTTSQHSVIIIATGPIIVLLMAVVLRLEFLTPAKILGMAISFVGVILLETDQGSPMHSPLLFGDIVTLAGVMGYSVYAVLGKKVVKQYDVFTLSTGNILASALMMAPLAVRQGMHIDWTSVGWAGWTGMLYMAIFSSILAYTLFYWVLRYMEASRVSAVNYFQPLIVIVLASVLLGESPSEHLIAGGALVLLGVYLAERNLNLSDLWRWRKSA